MKNLAIIFTCAFIAHNCAQGQAPVPPISTYTAAVVEYAPTWDPKDENTNTRRYVTIIKSDEVKEVDIITFPEATLNTLGNPAVVPKPEDKAVPCGNDKYSEIVKTLSCAAQETKKYVVVNLYMQRNCKEESTNDTRPCTKGDINIYNTAVAFDRAGTVVAVYRKFNLYLEDHEVRKTLKPDVSIFETDFGVKFGLLICFDLLFQSPTQQLLDAGVKNFAYPTMWYSELPFLTALQVQQGVAFAKNINLLAAGASDPKYQSTGSGLYAGQFGAQKAIIVDTAITKVLVAKLPKVPGTPLPVTPSSRSIEMKDEPIITPETIKLTREDMNEYDIKWLNFNENATQIGQTCKETVCCNYNISVNIPTEEPRGSHYFYVIAVRDGFRNTRNPQSNLVVTAGLKVCAVVACRIWNDVNSCGERFISEFTAINERYTFDRLQLNTHLPDESTLSIIPSTLGVTLLPLNTAEFKFSEKKYEDAHASKLQSISLDLLSPKSDIYTFGIFARDYSRDAEITASAGRVSTATVHLLLISFISSLLCFKLFVNTA